MCGAMTSEAPICPPSRLIITAAYAAQKGNVRLVERRDHGRAQRCPHTGNNVERGEFEQGLEPVMSLVER